MEGENGAIVPASTIPLAAPDETPVYAGYLERVMTRAFTRFSHARHTRVTRSPRAVETLPDIASGAGTRPNFRLDKGEARNVKEAFARFGRLGAAEHRGRRLRFQRQR
jgi:hypothetical protein